MNLTKNIYEHHGITTKKDLIKLARSQSTKDRLLPLNNSKKNSLVSAAKYDSQRTTYSLSDKTLYKECVDSIINSLKNMRSSEDVQTGIYLDIMNKK